MSYDKQIQNPDDTLSISDVAARLQVSERTLRTWIKAQKIPGFFRIGREWRIRKSDLDTFIGQKINERTNL